MSYHIDLDEYDEQQLRNELDRRKALRDKGLCDYCQRNGGTKPCKFRHRHSVAVQFWQRENRRKEGILPPGTYIGPLGSY